MGGVPSTSPSTSRMNEWSFKRHSQSQGDAHSQAHPILLYLQRHPNTAQQTRQQQPASVNTSLSPIDSVRSLKALRCIAQSKP